MRRCFTGDEGFRVVVVVEGTVGCVIWRMDGRNQQIVDGGAAEKRREERASQVNNCLPCMCGSFWFGKRPRDGNIERQPREGWERRGRANHQREVEMFQKRGDGGREGASQSNSRTHVQSIDGCMEWIKKEGRTEGMRSANSESNSRS